ncbi:hypothetical protein EAO71_30725 [Streptomyces sp. ms191]|uniref:hypothetical protein n=1 Tax=Streptomyces sp. ms191 TaxID=1827978 RepID=UPI0011CD5183|nr:hypothetical protein [Streptomyces sp. ms191]TXS20877.1 hypothetical protein EAO71_30725 [Streptomyces sp. ms191]
MTFETEADLLLLWIREKTAGMDSRISVDPHRSCDWSEAAKGEVFRLVAWLAERGLVNHDGQRYGQRNAGCNSFTTRCTLTPKGVREAERLLQLRGNKLHRFDTAANGLIVAAMDDVPDYHIVVQDFAASDRAVLLGQRIDAETIEKAAAFLVDNKLATVYSRSVAIRPREAFDPSYALALTPSGIQCGDQHINVRKFVANQQDARPVTTNIYGGNNQIGDHNTQNNNIGFPPDDLAQFAQQVLAAAVTMDVPEPIRERIAEDAEALQREAEREEPQPSRMRRALEGMRESLLQAGQDQAAQKLIEMAGNFLMTASGG